MSNAQSPYAFKNCWSLKFQRFVSNFETTLLFTMFNYTVFNNEFGVT